MGLYLVSKDLNAFNCPDAIWKIIVEFGGSVFKGPGSRPGFLLVFSSKPQMQNLNCEEEHLKEHTGLYGVDNW